MRDSGSKFLLVVVGCLLLLFAANGRRVANRSLEGKVPVASIRPSDIHDDSGPPALPAPTVEDVRQALDRIYAGAVVVQDSPAPSYMLGDFNGDGSPDLAVKVSPIEGRISELKDQLANWIVEDPSRIFVPNPAKPVQRFPPKPAGARVQKSQPVLVIVHGYGVQGWRAADARQSYLLVNAAGDGMKPATKEEIYASKSRNGPMPRLLGDVIYETRHGQAGFLFWTGGHYAWQRQ